MLALPLEKEAAELRKKNRIVQITCACIGLTGSGTLCKKPSALCSKQQVPREANGAKAKEEAKAPRGCECHRGSRYCFPRSLPGPQAKEVPPEPKKEEKKEEKEEKAAEEEEDEGALLMARCHECLNCDQTVG